MSNLPPEIITEILYRLPVKSLLRFTCVSKWWYALIHNPNFIKIHLNHSIKTDNERTLIILQCYVHLEGFYSALFHNDDSFGKAVIGCQPLKHPNRSNRIIGSCNGLVCISNPYTPDQEIAIWNPLIRKYKKLPVEPIEFPSGFGKCVEPEYGFGHDLVNDDYKVVRIVRFSNAGDDDYASEFKVYSLREHSWRRVVQEWPKEFFVNYSGIVFLNGALHFLVGLESNRYSESILAFDLASETFRTYTTPFQPNDETSIGLEVLGGKLCICVNEYETQNDVWAMQEYGVVSSWTRLYTLEQWEVRWAFDYCKPMMFSKDGKRVLLQQDYKNLIWFDKKRRQFRKVWICDMPDSFQTTICVGTLVLIDGDVVIDPRPGEEKRNKRKRDDSPSKGLNLLVETIGGERDQDQVG